MSYRELRAPAALAGLVECGWTDTAKADGAHQVLPDGCMDLVWTGTELLVAGPDTVAKPGRRTRGVTVAGLRFAPGALPSLLDVPAAPLQDRRVPLLDLLPGQARAALARLERGDEPVAVLAALATRLPGSPPDRSVAALRRALAPAGVVRPATPPPARADWVGRSAERWAGPPAAPGDRRAALPAEHRALAVAAGDSAGSVAAIADLLGCTPRSVHRRCLAAFGYGPAVLRRVLRFRRAAALLRAGVSPAEVAATAGYADQPHLSRETRALAGVSPGQLANGANRSTPLPSGSSTTA
jgi:AraC-like DNA-binding protein